MKTLNFLLRVLQPDGITNIQFKPNAETTVGDIGDAEGLLNKMAKGSGVRFEIKPVWVEGGDANG